MTVQIAIPRWVVPSAQQCYDVHWLAAWWVEHRSSAYAGGVGATVSWVLGEDAGPLTGRTQQPVSIVLADSERAVALAVDCDPAGAPFPLHAECAWLDTLAVAPVAAGRDRARAVGQTLRWLRGRDEAPLPTPERGDDGRVFTVEELYEAAMACYPHRYELPEQRNRLRMEAAARARQSAALVSMIKEMQR